MTSPLFSCDTIQNLSLVRNSIMASVQDGGYAVVRGLFDQSKIKESLKAVYQYANSASHQASSGLAAADVRRNTSKWSIRGPEDGPARFALVIYNPLFDSDLFQLREAFDRIIEIRDTIAGREVLRDADLLPARFNACRVQIYPAGGGFIGEHRDVRGESNLPQGSFVEILLLLTEKGIDYHKGGAVVRFREAALQSETAAKRGDVIIYDGSTIHGVHAIDPDIPFNARDLRGRAVAFATIYGQH
jgi:hypothetical protein